MPPLPSTPILIEPESDCFVVAFVVYNRGDKKGDRSFMNEIVSFGEWVAQRRKSLDMTQRELAARSTCALATIKKIEAGERRPSRELAELLADALCISVDKTAVFVECARGLRRVDVLAAMTRSSPDERQRPTARFAADLPASATPFIGRALEVAQIVRLLEQPACRLLTLVGTGGAGKTRLALEAARAQRDRVADGVVFVSLAAVTDPCTGYMGHPFRTSALLRRCC